MILACLNDLFGLKDSLTDIITDRETYAKFDAIIRRHVRSNVAAAGSKHLVESFKICKRNLFTQNGSVMCGYFSGKISR